MFYSPACEHVVAKQPILSYNHCFFCFSSKNFNVNFLETLFLCFTDFYTFTAVLWYYRFTYPLTKNSKSSNTPVNIFLLPNLQHRMLDYIKAMSEVLSEFLKMEISRPVEPTLCCYASKIDTDTT